MKKIALNSEVWKEGNMFTAYCHELDVASCGRTPEEARKNLLEALEIFFLETSRKGTLLDILEESGFAVRNESLLETPYLFMSQEKIEMDLKL